MVVRFSHPQGGNGGMGGSGTSCSTYDPVSKSYRTSYAPGGAMGPRGANGPQGARGSDGPAGAPGSEAVVLRR